MTPVSKRRLEHKLATNDVRLLALELDRRNAARSDFVERALGEGRIAPEQRESLETLFTRDPEAARKFVDELPADRMRAAQVVWTESDDRRYVDSAAARLGISAGQAIV